MKYLLPLFIIFTIAFRPLMPLLDYAVNYNYIVEQKCENRAKPELGCNGKCYLMKELAKASGENLKQNSLSANKFFSMSDTFLVADLFSLKFKGFNNFEKKGTITFQLLAYQFKFHSNIFHPPLV